jgi:glyoxalase/bleomycin resistance protein/dioxygenase superfamily protein
MSPPEDGAKLSFHHLGVACKSIDAELPWWMALGYRREGEPFADRNQGIRGIFLSGGGPRIELLEELPGSSVLQPWLRGGTKIYHHCYETADLAGESERLRRGGAALARRPMPAIAFGGRCVSFFVLPSRYLVELLESETTGAGQSRA